MARNPDEGHKLFVGRLPGDCTEDELRIVFSTYGEVNSIILLKPHDRTGNRSAFVFYKDRNAGEDAIKLLNDQYKIRQDAELTLAVRWAQRRGGDAAPMDDSEAAHSSDGFKLFVGGLPPDIREDELQMVFSTYGEVSLVHCMPPSNQSGMSAAFVFYKQKEAAEDAIRLLDNQYKIREDAEQPISVRWGRDKSKGKGGGKGDYSYDSGSNNHSSNKAHDDWNQGGSSWDSSSYGAGATGGAGSQSSGDPKVFVGGLPADITQEEVETVFSTYGKVQKIHLFEPHQVNNLVAGFVFYETQEAAEDAIKLLDGVYKIREEAPAPITVKWARKDTRGGGGGGGGGGSSGGGRGSQWDQSDGGGWKSSSWQSSGSGGGGGGSWGDNSWKDSYSGGGQQNGRGGDYYNRGESQSYSGSANYGSGGGGQGGGYGNYGGGHSSGGGGGGGCGAAKEYGGGGGGDRPKNKVFVGNLPSDITEDALQYVFGNYGKVIDVHVMAGKSKSGQSCAFVNYNDPLEAETAIMTLHEKYEIRPGQGPIIVKTANPQNRSKPY